MVENKFKRSDNVIRHQLESCQSVFASYRDVKVTYRPQFTPQNVRQWFDPYQKIGFGDGRHPYKDIGF